MRTPSIYGNGVKEISQDMVSWYKKTFPKGTRVELLRYTGMKGPPLGTKGTVDHVDKAGNIHVKWDTGHETRIVYRCDSCRKVE